MNDLYDHTDVAICILCWAITCAGATVAVFSRRIVDGVLERFFLCGVAIGSIATSYRIYQMGKVSDGGQFLSICIAGWVVAIFLKHYRIARRLNQVGKK